VALMAYTLRGKLIDPAHVGQLYHIGIGTTSPGASAVDNLCGYNLVDDQQLGRFIEKTDLHTKSTLTQYSSENIIDRDFVNTPRVTDGDFSGGALQQTWIDSHRFWDSDLDPRTPGYLMLNPAWARKQLVASTPVSISPQCVAWLGDVWTTFNEANFKYYRSDGTSFVGAGIRASVIDTDGESLFIADSFAGGLKSTKDNAAYTNIPVIGAIIQMWAINLGTTGRFLYYTTDNRTLFKVDLATNTVGITVPLGGAQYRIVDVVAYLAGVAVLTQDPGSTGFDVWYQDGQNLQHIIRVDQYFPSGLCLCLGQLYVTAQSVGQFEAPVLMLVSAGSFQIILRAGTPFSTATLATIGDPHASGQYVYFPLQTPQINGISAVSYIGVYDTLAGVYWHLPPMDANDFVLNPGAIRAIACSGRAVTFAVITGGVGGVGWLQYQVNSNKLPAVSPKYQATGWLCSSRIDFQTPGIAKLFRRIMVHHAPLNLGESIQVNGYIDIDPIKFTTALAPTATVTHAYSVSDSNPTVTVLTFPLRTLAHSMTFALKLTAGTGNLTTPNVYYVNMEIAVPWTWEGWFDLTFRRRLLNGDEDSDQTPADLYWLLHNAWENAQPVTLYHPNGSTYTAAIEELRFEARNPVNERTPEHPAGVEWWAYILLRDSLE
jgi:hypothetical protein